MKRSSSKLIAKAGSMRNINKQGYKFHVLLRIETVDKILAAHEVIFSWERNAKILQTKPVKVDKESRIANFNQEVLQQEITFFKRKKSDSPFEDKVFRCLLRDANNPKKIVGKIDLNFSSHIDIPSSSKKMAASLNNGSKLVFKFESKFIAEAVKKSKNKDKDTSSLSSYNTDDMESEFDPKDQDMDLADLNDLEDLDISDDPVDNDNPSSQQQQQSQLQPQRPPLNPSPSTDDSLAIQAQQNTKFLRKTSSNVTPATTGKSSRGRRSRDPSPGRLNDVPKITSSSNFIDSQSDNSFNQTPSQQSTNFNATSTGSKFRKASSRNDYNENNMNNNNNSSSNSGVSKMEMEALRKENRSLKRRNDDLQSRVSELEYRLDSVNKRNSNNHVDQSAEIEDLELENKSLKEHIEDLEVKIKREPIYSDVVKDLREAKMALAIMNLERDELKQELRRLRR